MARNEDGKLYKVEGKDLVLQRTGRTCVDYHKAQYEDVYAVVYGKHDKETIYEDDVDYYKWNLIPITDQDMAGLLYGPDGRSPNT